MFCPWEYLRYSVTNAATRGRRVAIISLRIRRCSLLSWRRATLSRRGSETPCDHGTVRSPDHTRRPSPTLGYTDSAASAAVAVGSPTGKAEVSRLPSNGHGLLRLSARHHGPGSSVPDRSLFRCGGSTPSCLHVCRPSHIAVSSTILPLTKVNMLIPEFLTCLPVAATPIYSP